MNESQSNKTVDSQLMTLVIHNLFNAIVIERVTNDYEHKEISELEYNSFLNSLLFNKQILSDEELKFFIAYLKDNLPNLDLTDDKLSLMLGIQEDQINKLNK